MAFPNDLSNVVVFKIHPAIGIARVSNNDDFYVFGVEPGNYKSNGLIKRQAVRFRIFAYGENHEGLGELTPQIIGNLNIEAVWSARVANRKVAKWEGTPLGGTQFVISAEASSDDANQGKLVGSLPQFAEGANIPLGQIMPDGLFIPPKGGVFRKTAGEPIEPYPATSKKVADTTGDGSVTVRLKLNAQELPVLPACIVVAPQDFSPDTNESDTLYDWLKRKLNIASAPVGNIHNQTARALDSSALKPATWDFDPGFEVDLGSVDRTEVVDLQSIYCHSNQDPLVDPREIRVRYRSSSAEPGAVPGQLTSGLCSTWQGDFVACVGYWSEHLPPEAFLDEDTQTAVQVFRKTYSDTSSGAETLSTGDEYDRHVDKMGVVRLRSGRKVETERNPGDDV